jgi:hypothetical protein
MAAVAREMCHQFCKDCLVSWTSIKVLEERAMRIPCLSAGCVHAMERFDILRTNSALVSAWDALAASAYAARARDIEKDEPVLWALMQEGYLQSCPKCKALMQKVDGCDSVVCSTCSTSFCYSCGELQCACHFVMQGLPREGDFTCTKCMTRARGGYFCPSCRVPRYNVGSVEADILFFLSARFGGAAGLSPQFPATGNMSPEYWATPMTPVLLNRGSYEARSPERGMSRDPEPEGTWGRGRSRSRSPARGWDRGRSRSRSAKGWDRGRSRSRSPARGWDRRRSPARVRSGGKGWDRGRSRSPARDRSWRKGKSERRVDGWRA